MGYKRPFYMLQYRAKGTSNWKIEFVDTDDESKVKQMVSGYKDRGFEANYFNLN